MVQQNDDLRKLMELKGRLKTYSIRKILLLVFGTVTLYTLISLLIGTVDITQNYQYLKLLAIVVVLIGMALLLWAVLNLATLFIPIISYMVLNDAILSKFVLKDVKNFFDVDYKIDHFIDEKIEERRKHGN